MRHFWCRSICLLRLMCYTLQWVPELTRMGVSSVLARMENDPSQNVRRTAATAMAQFAKPEAEAMACDDD